jgi:hypothetical protein
MQQLPVTSDVLIAELDLAIKVLEKWRDSTKEGTPGVDVPGAQDMLENYLRALCGELLLVSGKCEALANILSSGV